MHYVKLGSKRNSGMGGTEGINMVLFLLVATTSRFVGKCQVIRNNIVLII